MGDYPMTCTVTGMVDVYKAKAGRDGIDACVPLSVAVKMFKLMSAKGASSDFRFCQTEVGGFVMVDAQVSAPVGAKVLAAAERAGAPIRR